MSIKAPKHSPRRVAAAIFMLAALFVLSICRQELAQAQNRKEAQKKEASQKEPRDPYGSGHNISNPKYYVPAR